jgi:hypothetical protein
MDLSPTSALIVSMHAATSVRLAIAVEPGVLSRPRRAAASEKLISSRVKCAVSLNVGVLQIMLPLVIGIRPMRSAVSAVRADIFRLRERRDHARHVDSLGCIRRTTQRHKIIEREITTPRRSHQRAIQRIRAIIGASARRKRQAATSGHSEPRPSHATRDRTRRTIRIRRQIRRRASARPHFIPAVAARAEHRRRTASLDYSRSL